MPIYPKSDPNGVNAGKLKANADFQATQAGRWTQTGDPHLEQSGIVNGDIITFPDGSFTRDYSKWHQMHLNGAGPGQGRPGEGSGSQYDRWVAQLTRGEVFDYNGPTVFGNFLSQESAPGGFLSPANTSNETARGVREIFNQGKQQRSAIASSLESTGLNERYAKGSIALAEQDTTEKANEYLSSASFASGERRFQATLDFLNQAAAATKASMIEKENLKRAQSEAKRRIAGGVFGAIGGAFGGYIGGPAGAAAGYGIGSGLGQGIS